MSSAIILWVDVKYSRIYFCLIPPNVACSAFLWQEWVLQVLLVNIVARTLMQSQVLLELKHELTHRIVCYVNVTVVL